MKDIAGEAYGWDGVGEGWQNWNTEDWSEMTGGLSAKREAVSVASVESYANGNYGR